MGYHQHTFFKVGIFLLFLLATTGCSVGAEFQQQVQGEDKSQLSSEPGPPYLDEEGNLCQDKVEVFQDTEYETMIQCRVAMKKSCTNQKVNASSEPLEPQEACTTVYEKNCQTVYRPHRSKVRIRVCPDGNVNVADSPFQSHIDHEDNENNIVLDVRPDPRAPSPSITKKCHKGRRTVCTTKYHTECITQQVQQTMQEDHPKCQVEMVERCSETIPDKCQRVPAMRCRIEKRTVVKTKPESKCNRVPRQFCRKEDCKSDPEDNFEDQNCYYRTQIVNEILPEEKCNLLPKQMCHPVKNQEVALRRKKRSSETSLSFLRNHYLRRKQNQQMLPRQSRNFANSEGEEKVAQTRQICTTIPEQVCEKKRVNPRTVEKKMMKKFCRQPRSYFDRLLVAKLSKV